MINIYGLKNCDGCRKAFKWLDKNNYFYIENNKLFDRFFMEWFCKRFLNIVYDSSMYIELYDNLMNKHQIYSNNYIILKKNNFDII